MHGRFMLRLGNGRTAEARDQTRWRPGCLCGGARHSPAGYLEMAAVPRPPHYRGGALDWRTAGGIAAGPISGTTPEGAAMTPSSHHHTHRQPIPRPGPERSYLTRG